MIGRSSEKATLAIGDNTLSRVHARLFAEGERIYIEDLHSTNGTSVNGKPVGPSTARAVDDGDRIAMGAVRVQLTLDS